MSPRETQGRRSRVTEEDRRKEKREREREEKREREKGMQQGQRVKGKGKGKIVKIKQQRSKHALGMNRRLTEMESREKIGRGEVYSESG
ncbi:hypothetical protein BO83DRAFT_174863 [Aspergillus eucalypticola CBS 122712]|uniref:Uncharacterized protein n=1 Tax=Aspergillus eucalypticola (strain CBS 122712 / IBT 29274) TaxID=1448314 RepID=A0A317W448_ASPEC|nr:uncharacterized protein BO83DRAFT_174863 [Aspergillus eucalypticola CBS 122712]PWY81354.1 hypothetical protein BO83DRAFT_174863 [Aspergillus eucalypticola CBS 122712]